MRIRLSDEDRARLGAPEWIEFDDRKLMAREIVAMQKATGWGPERLQLAMAGRMLRDEAGKPIQAEDPVTGVPEVDGDGNPVFLRDVEVEAIIVAVWMALRRAQVQVAYDELDFDVSATEFDDTETPGKASSPATT